MEFHTTAYGGLRQKENSLFVGVIAQSPAPIIVDPKWRALGANIFLEAARARSVDLLRKLPSEVLQAANLKAQAPALYTVEIFGDSLQLLRMLAPLIGPSIDGHLIPDIPSRLYSRGEYNKNLHVMAAHQANEVCCACNGLMIP